MDCVIRVIKGPDAGMAAKLPPGATMIGRSTTAGLRLTPDEVSWEHLVITRNGDEYTAENLSSHGTWFDGGKITGAVRLRPRDQLKVGETVLRLEPAEGLGVNRTRILAVAMVSLLATAIAIVVMQQVRGGGTGTPDWSRAYAVIELHLDNYAARPARSPEQITIQAVFKDAAKVLRDAWRQEQAGDFAASQKSWLRLKVLLDSIEDRERMSAMAADPARKNVLDNILLPQVRKGPPPPPEDVVSRADADDLSAATVQFVNRRLTFASAKAKKSSSGWFK